MELLLCNTVDLLYLVPHHPAEQVDAVNALIHQAAAVLGPGPPPGSLIVIVPVSVPSDVNGTVGDPAEAARLHGAS